MAIEVYWLVPDHVGYLKFIGDITIEELRDAANFWYDVLESTDSQLVHALHDGTPATSLPKNLNQVRAATNDALTHEHSGWTVSVGIGDSFMRFIALMVGKLTRMRQRILKDLDEGLVFLSEADESLPDLRQIDLTQIPLLKTFDYGEANKTPTPQ